MILIRWPFETMLCSLLSLTNFTYSKTCLKLPLKIDRKIAFKTDYGLMQVNLSTFIKLPFVVKTFVLSIFEWPF